MRFLAIDTLKSFMRSIFTKHSLVSSIATAFIYNWNITKISFHPCPPLDTVLKESENTLKMSLAMNITRRLFALIRCSSFLYSILKLKLRISRSYLNMTSLNFQNEYYYIVFSTLLNSLFFIVTKLKTLNSDTYKLWKINFVKQK